MTGDSRLASAIARRIAIVQMWQKGIPIRNISNRTGSSVTTVYRWVRRWQEQGTVEAKPYRRKPRAMHWQREVIMAPIFHRHVKNRNTRSENMNLVENLQIRHNQDKYDIYIWLNEICRLIFVYHYNRMLHFREHDE